MKYHTSADICLFYRDDIPCYKCHENYKYNITISNKSDPIQVLKIVSYEEWLTWYNNINSEKNYIL